MSDFSNYYEDKIIDHMIRGEAFTPPAAVYVALFTAATGLEANAPTAEVAGVGYERQALTLSAASGGASASNVILVFGPAVGDWVEATHFAIVDHQTNINWGVDVNVLMWKALTTPRINTSGNELKFAIGDLTASVS